MITIYQARKILTMNPRRPLATHVAVRDGRILGAGSLAELEGWGEYQLDATFADKVLMPGLVEGHSHVSRGRAMALRLLRLFRSHRSGRQDLVRA